MRLENIKFQRMFDAAANANLGIISEKHFLELCSCTTIRRGKTEEERDTKNKITSKVISLPTCFECTTSTISTLKHVRAMCLSFFSSQQPNSLRQFFRGSVFVCCEFHISLLGMHGVYRAYNRGKIGCHCVVKQPIGNE